MNILNITCSLILVYSIFFIVGNLGEKEVQIDYAILKRLKNIKNKVFLIKQKKNMKKQKFKAFFSTEEYKILFLGEILNKLKFTEKLKKQLKIADMKTPVDSFLLSSLGIFCFFFCIAAAFNGNSAIIAAGVFFAYIPFLMVKMRIKKRHELFTQQFPDTLGLISSALRAGHSLSSSFSLVVNEMPEPVSQIFKLVIDDMSLGRDTRESLDNMSNHMPDSIDLRFFITAVLIQREIGGNLAEILDNLGHTIRERFKLIGQLNAQTAQAKMSGIVLALAPVVIGTLIWFMNPTYMLPLFNSLLGQLTLASAVLMGIIGFVCIKHVTNIKV